jgi:hypothetical protein
MYWVLRGALINDLAFSLKFNFAVPFNLPNLSIGLGRVILSHQLR